MIFRRPFIFFLALFRKQTTPQVYGIIVIVERDMTRDVIHWFMLYIYILIVMMTFLRCCFVINLDAIGYVINSVGVVEFSTCIFGII
jgi:hypothetical protein